MSTVFSPNAKPRAVKNLGWLLRHWQSVAEIGFTYCHDPKTVNDGELWAKLRDGRTYITRFASLTVAWRWLNRPVFRGLPFTLSRLDHPTYSRRCGVIGSGPWIKLQRLADHGGKEQHEEFYATLGLR